MKLLMLSELLLEGKLDDLERKYGPRIQEILTSEDSDMSPRALINKLNELDISKNKSLTNWLLKLFLTGDIHPDEMSMDYIVYVFEEYKKHKQLFAGKDITTFNSMKEILDTINNAPISNTKADNELKKHFLDTKQIVFEQKTERGTLYSVHTKEAMQWIGRGTKWCVSAKDDNRFDQYNKGGTTPIYVWIDKPTKQKYAFDTVSYSFQDELDHDVTGSDVYKYCERTFDMLKAMDPITKTLKMMKNAEDDEHEAWINKIEELKDSQPGWDFHISDIFDRIVTNNDFSLIPACVFYYTEHAVDLDLVDEKIINFFEQIKHMTPFPNNLMEYANNIERMLDFISTNGYSN